MTTHPMKPSRLGAARAARTAWPRRGHGRGALAALAAVVAAAALAGCAGGPTAAPQSSPVPVSTQGPAAESTRPAAAPAAPAARGAQAIPPGIVSVVYDDPSRFSDTRMAPHESDRARRAWVDALCQYLSERAAAALPDGQRLEVRLTDVQRAGGFEPARGPQLSQVRIVRDIYPPSIDLEFKRLAADGSVLQSGRRELRDPSFLPRAGRGSGDALRYEKALIDDWVRTEIGAPLPQ